jgi:hypothetical protein
MRRDEKEGVAIHTLLLVTCNTAIFRIADGKLVELWQHWDQLGMLQQLGVVPALGQAGG